MVEYTVKYLFNMANIDNYIILFAIAESLGIIGITEIMQC